MDLLVSTETVRVCSPTPTAKMNSPTNPEATSEEVVWMLDILRDHKKYAESVLSSKFHKWIVQFSNVSVAWLENEKGERTAAPSAKTPTALDKLSAKIIKKKPTNPKVYIEYFEELCKLMVEPKTCTDCLRPFYPVENYEKRKYCRSCM